MESVCFDSITASLAKSKAYSHSSKCDSSGWVGYM